MPLQKSLQICGVQSPTDRSAQACPAAAAHGLCYTTRRAHQTHRRARAAAAMDLNRNCCDSQNIYSSTLAILAQTVFCHWRIEKMSSANAASVQQAAAPVQFPHGRNKMSDAACKLTVLQESVEASDRICRDRRFAAAANAAGFYKGSSPPAVSSRCQCDDDPNAQWSCPACIAAAALQQAAVRSDIDGSCLDVATLKPLQSADLWNYPVHESEACKAEWRRQLCGRSFALREPIG